MVTTANQSRCVWNEFIVMKCFSFFVDVKDMHGGHAVTFVANSAEPRCLAIRAIAKEEYFSNCASTLGDLAL